MTRRPLALSAALSLLVAVGVLAVATPASAANLLANPGFETGTLSPWSCTGGLGSVVGTPVRSGTKALQGAASSSDNAKCSQTVAVQPNTAYALTGWVRGNYVYLGIDGGASTWTPGAAAFTQLTVNFTTGASQTSVVVYTHGWYGQGTYFADDISLDGPGGTGVPGVPGNPSVGTITNTSIALSWGASSGTVTGYRVYEGTTVRATVTGTSTTVTGLAACSAHTYTVAAYNASGESAKSGGVSATTTGCTTVPPTPTGLAVTGATNTSVSLSWSASSGATGYRVYEGTTQVATGTGTTATVSGLATCSAHAYTVAAYNASGESAKSGAVSATTTGCVNTGLPKHALIGYLHASFANGSGYLRMADVPSSWDIINLAFGEPTSVTSGDIRFRQCPVAECPNVESETDFIAAIRAKQAQGKKVLISIGGANGQVQLTSTAARDTFVSSVSAIIDKYGLNGLDIDFEGHSLYLNAGDGDIRNPTTPVIVNLISALRTLKARYGSGFILTMAPETFFVQLGYQFYGGTCSGCDNRAGSYLPVIYALRNDITVLHVQDYNSGPIMGLDNQYHNMGAADFHIAMTDMLAAGFPVANTGVTFPALREDQIAFGVPAAVSAGGGYTTPAQVQQAVNCLVKNQNCGGYTLRGGTSPDFRGLMTWSINWDRYYNWEFSNSHEPFLNALP
ncbi:glycosyl hydrolase family 18 protein [Catellatospora sp. NPDC049111]|uniref:fibronectin type III domain-containing protein n=1 Tax=Catellatospora sp. NPDC049111 TaxID=3155271 RepID=UPI00340EE7EF